MTCPRPGVGRVEVGVVPAVRRNRHEQFAHRRARTCQNSSGSVRAGDRQAHADDGDLVVSTVSARVGRTSAAGVGPRSDGDPAEHRPDGRWRSPGRGEHARAEAEPAVGEDRLPGDPSGLRRRRGSRRPRRTPPPSRSRPMRRGVARSPAACPPRRGNLSATSLTSMDAEAVFTRMFSGANSTAR